MMTKKCFAAIGTAKEISAEIQKLTDEIKEKGPSVAYANALLIAELNDRFCRDFGNVDPYWMPPQKGGKPTRETYVPPEAADEEILT